MVNPDRERLVLLAVEASGRRSRDRDLRLLLQARDAADQRLICVAIEVFLDTYEGLFGPVGGGGGAGSSSDGGVGLGSSDGGVGTGADLNRVIGPGDPMTSSSSSITFGGGMRSHVGCWCGLWDAAAALGFDAILQRCS